MLHRPKYIEYPSMRNVHTRMHFKGIIVSPFILLPLPSKVLSEEIYSMCGFGVGKADVSIKIYGLVCTKRKCRKCCHTESRFKEILCMYCIGFIHFFSMISLCTTLGVDGHTASSFEVTVTMLRLTMALFEKGQLGKKWIHSREKSSLQVGLAHCRNKRV